MKTLAVVMFCYLSTGMLLADEIPRPLVELLFTSNMTNTGTYGGDGQLVEWAPGEGGNLGAGLRGRGLDLTASSRGGGNELTKAGSSVIMDGKGIEKLQQMTLALWFKPSGLNSPSRLLYYAPSWDLSFSNGMIGFKTRHNRKDQGHVIMPARPIEMDGRWNFIAITFDDIAGEARCYHGFRGSQVKHVCTWRNIPKLDRGSAILEIGNLSGIRPFKGWIDSVRIFDRLFSLIEIEQVHALESIPRRSLRQLADNVPDRSAVFRHGDVCLSSRSIRPKSIETIKDFRANRLTWSYSADADFIRNCKSAGITTFQGTINSLPGHSNTNAHCLDLDGKPMVAPWMVAFSRVAPTYWGCNNRKQFMETSLERAIRALDAGADSIQFDDWSMIDSASRWGGACFCDDCMVGFREYLKLHLSEQERTNLKIGDPGTFNYRRYLAKQHGIADAKTYKSKRGALQITKYFEKFQRLSVRKFFMSLRKQINAHAGRTVPLSINSTFLKPDQSTNFMPDLVDFLQGEIWYFDRMNLAIASKTAEGLGKWQVFVPKPKNVQQMRMGIASTYAMGQIMLVPWDMYMGSDANGIQPRYYGTVEEYGDLYHFIRDHADLFDGYQNPASVGVIVDLDRFNRARVRLVCQRLFDTQTPFNFVIAGHSYYEAGLNADYLKKYELLLLTSDEHVLAKKDQAALRAVSAQTSVVLDREASAELIRSESPIEVWGPSDISVLPRVKPDPSERKLICHVLNRAVGDDVKELKWVSFLVKRWALHGNKLASVKWHVPGKQSINIEFEMIEQGARIIIPRLPIWGIAELQFE